MKIDWLREVLSFGIKELFTEELVVTGQIKRVACYSLKNTPYLCSISVDGKNSQD